MTTLPSPAPGIHARITEVTVSAIPEGNVDHDLYAIQVQWRGDDRYAVKRRSLVLGADGEWDYEPTPSSRDDDWIATHRFGYNEALQRAVEAAPHCTVNGSTVADSLATVRAAVEEMITDSCTCPFLSGADPACPVHQGRRARGPKPPPLGPGCICDGSGRTCPRHGAVI